MSCVLDVWRFGRRSARRAPGYCPRSAALSTSAEVEEARWATPARVKAQKEYTQLREMQWPLSPGSPVPSFAPEPACAHEALLHAEDGACAKWCALCNAWVKLPATHCLVCRRCVCLRDGHSCALGVCVGADNRARYCALMARALLLQLSHAGLAACSVRLTSDAAALRAALAAAAQELAVPSLSLAELRPCAPAVALGALAALSGVGLALCLLRQLCFCCLVLWGGDASAQHQFDVRRRSDCRQRVLAWGGASRWAALRAEVLRMRPVARDSERDGLLNS